MYKVSGRHPLITWWWTVYLIPVDREAANITLIGEGHKLDSGFKISNHSIQASYIPHILWILTAIFMNLNHLFTEIHIIVVLNDLFIIVFYFSPNLHDVE